MLDILVLVLIKANKLKHRNLASNIVESPIIELALTLCMSKCSISWLKVDSILLLAFEIKFLNALGNGVLLLLLFNAYNLIPFSLFKSLSIFPTYPLSPNKVLI